jgi:hypothetical protein
MKKYKSIIDTYDPVLYPDLLIVVKNTTVEQLNKKYSTASGDNITEDYLGYGYACVTFCATRRKDNRKCIIVYQPCGLNKIDKNALINATHEAGHYVMEVFRDISAELSYNYQEPFCYLLQWAATNIYNTLNKKDNGSKRKK